MPASRGTTPSTGMPMRSIPSRSMASCPGEPTRFNRTPAIRTAGSNARNPSAIAAADVPIAFASMTSTTGAPSISAISAVELTPPGPPS